MKKMLLAFLFSILTISSCFAVSAVKITKDTLIKQEVANSYPNAEQLENFTGYQFLSYGPKKILYTSFSIDNGSVLNRSLIGVSLFMTLLSRFMVLKIPPLARPIFLLVSNIDFTITYKRNTTWNNTRNRYFTHFGYYENGTLVGENTTIVCTKHTVKVEGFKGFIFLTKRSIRWPPIIMVAGFAMKVSIIET